MFNKELLIKIMNEKNITAYKLAKKSHVAQSTLSTILTGNNKNPSSNTLSKLAEALGVPVTDFFEEKTETEKEKNEQLNDKDKKSIDKDLNNIMQEFREGTDGTAYYNGVELEESDLDLIESAMKIALEQIKIKNKEKYTPKKYKK